MFQLIRGSAVLRRAVLQPRVRPRCARAYYRPAFSVTPSRVIPRRRTPESKAGHEQTAKRALHWSSSRSVVLSPEKPAVLSSDHLVKSNRQVVVSKFADMSDLDDRFKDILASQGLVHRTEVQAKTWAAALEGRDVMSRARTGTGKTLAVLLPSLQRIIINTGGRSRQAQTIPIDRKVSILVLSPTRELATQIANVAELFATKDGRITNQVMVGGTSKQQDLKRMEHQIPTILTATPGRLMDHLGVDGSLHSIVNDIPFGDYLDELQVLILDEVDRLLDMGFREDLQRIVSRLPPDRQTLVVSATIPKKVQHLMMDDGLVKPNFLSVDCIADAALIEDEDSESHPWTSTTAVAGDEISVDPSKIEQSHVLLPQDRLISGIAQIILQLMEDPNHKVVVFFPTTSQVTYFSNLFHLALGRRVMSLHSKKSQTARAVTSELFREARQAVLFTSDVSARGVDYPEVSHVVQIGAAADRDTYIHRIGRTGRAGKTGKGLLVLLMDAEKTFLEHDLTDFDIPEDRGFTKMLQKPPRADVEMSMMQAAKEMRSGENKELVENAEDMYCSLLGYYHTRLKALKGSRSTTSPSKRPLVDTLNSMAAQAGLNELPVVPETLAKQVGPHGLNVQSRWSVGQGFDVGRRQGRVEGRADSFLPRSKPDP